MGYNNEIMKRVRVRMVGDQLANKIVEDCVIWKRDITGGIERSIREIEIGAKLSEEDFYRCWIGIRSVIDRELYGKVEIDARAIDVLVLMLMKSEDWVMNTDGKDGKQLELSKELGRSIKSLYGSIKKLKDIGYLVVTEDRFLELSSELSRLRRVIRKDISEGMAFGVSYVMNFIIS